MTKRILILNNTASHDFKINPSTCNCNGCKKDPLTCGGNSSPFLPMPEMEFQEEGERTPLNLFEFHAEKSSAEPAELVEGRTIDIGGGLQAFTMPEIRFKPIK